MQQLMLTSQVVTLGATGKHMCEGEYESLKAIHAVSPGFVPEPFAWGQYTEEGPETYFLLAEFRDVGRQVCTLKSSVVRYPHGLKSIRELPFGAAACSTISLYSRFGCPSSRFNRKFLSLPRANLWNSRQVLLSSRRAWPICIRNLYLPPGNLAFTWLPVTPKLLKRSTLGKIHGVLCIPDTLGM